MENSIMGVLRPVAHAALIALFTLGGAGTLAAQTAALVPNAKQIFVNANGAPLAGGSVTSYVPNTTVPKTTWLDENEVTPNANPVTLDASGGAFIFGQGNYRQIVKDANGNLIWDGFTSAYGSSSPAGATGSDTAPVGTILPWAGFNFNVPTNWALAYGQALSRTTYPQLLAAITISTTTGNCTASSATISGFSDTSQLAVGSPIEASCLPTGDTVASIVNGTTITVAVAATATGTFTVTAFPWGNGDGVSTFNVPDLRGRVLPGADAMGGSAAGRLTSAYYGTSAATPAIAGGNQYESSSFTLAQNQLPNIAPAFSGSSGSVSVTSTVGGIIHNATIVGGVGTGAANYDAFDPGASASTVTSAGTFTPSGTVASINGNVTQQSVPYSLTTIQPSITMDWIIKIAPNTTGAGGVTSANGLFGDVLWLAGTGMSVNTTSPNITYSCIPALSSVIGCVQPDGVTTTVNASGVLTAIGAATTSIDAGGATSISNGLGGDLLYDNAGKVGHETLLPLANGGLGASQASATANQIPVFPGSGGGAVPTSFNTWQTGVITGTISAKTTSYSAVSGDCGSTLSLGGGNYYSLTVGAASGFPSQCTIQVVNADTGRGKLMSISGFTWPYGTLYPGQSFLLTNDGGTWVVTGLSRWKVPGGTTNFYTDFTNGDDANDGLAAGTGGAKKTVQACLDTISNDLDVSAWSGQSGEPYGQGQIVCNVAQGSTDTQGVHWSPRAILGGQGGAAVQIVGSGTGATIDPAAASAIGCFLNGAMQVKNLTLGSGGGSAVSAGYDCDVELVSGITFAAVTQAHMSVQEHATIRVDANYTISGNAAQHMLAQEHGVIKTAGGSITVTGGSQAFTTFAQASNGGTIEMGSVTYSGMGSATGQRYNAAALGNINTGSGSATYFPGATSGTTNCTTSASSIGLCGMYN